MRHPFLGHALLLLPIGALAACGPEQETQRFDFPRLVLSTELVEFGALPVDQSASTTRTVWMSNLGDLPMGVTAIQMGHEVGADDKSVNFGVTWSRSEMECPETGDTAEPQAKGFTTDSGAPQETGGPGPDDTGDVDDSDVLIVGPDCRIPLHVGFTPQAVGTLWGSLFIFTDTDEVAEGSTADPDYYSDPIHTKNIVYLEGDGEKGIANIMVQPRRHDFGHIWTGSEETAYITIRNAGGGELTVAEPYLDDCAETFSISSTGIEGSSMVLEAGISTFVGVTYSPDDTSAAECTLVIESSDEDSGRIEVDFEANTGSDPDNVPATVVIRSPSVGHMWSGNDTGSLRMELNIFDVNQPADSLTCRVKSMVKAEGASIAHCEADDASGHVFVDVPFEYVENGVDTLKVQVTDAAQTISSASISVLWNAGFPESDDDGDGWGDERDADEAGNFDCDDLDINTYPFAAEIPDGNDNDCDGVIDEGTTGYDDDGDSFSEAEGDCNDYDEDVYPGAWELADYKDNDCDGVEDESTSLYDDDGDGYTDMDQDCDDDNADVNPGAIEYCDGIDNDCDGLRDYSDSEGCVEIDSKPYIVGGIKLKQTACEPGDSIQASVLAFDADGQDLDYAWTAEGGLVITPLTGSPSVTITCPEPDSRNGSVYALHVYITDADQNPVWDFDEMWVYSENDLYRQLVKIVFEQTGGCSSGGALPALSLAWLALVGAAIRRRRD